MERLIGPDLEVVLSLNEGHDFGFVNSQFIISASLGYNAIDTNVFSCEQLVKFDSELIWISNKSNVKRMRNYKVPIRIDFFKFDDKKHSKPFGYVIINLKSAQFVAKGEYVQIKEDIYKVCGLGKEGKGSSPQIVLSLRIQEVIENADNLSERCNGSEIHHALPVKASDSSIILKMPEKEPCQLPIAPNKIQLIPLLETSNNTVSTLVASSQMHACHSYQLDIYLADIKWMAELKNVHFRFHHAKAEVSWSTHKDIIETIPGDTIGLKNLSAHFSFIESPNEINQLLVNVPPILTVCTTRQDDNKRPQVLAKGSILTPSLEMRELVASSELRSLLTMEPVATFSFSALLTDHGPQICRQLPVADCDDFLADRLKNELEAWKEKERIGFEKEYEERLKAEISRLQLDWSVREKELEKEASDRMAICRTLGDELQKVMDDVKQKEKHLEKTKNELEISYQKLVADTKAETTALRVELLHNLKEKDCIISDLNKEVETMRNKRKNEDQSDSLSAQQIETLLSDTKKLQEKLEHANNSKAFFKEQWGRAIRELHRIKSEGWKDIQVQLQFRNDELKQLGIDY